MSPARSIFDLDSPVVIAGVGGSGTRVVAACVQGMGTYLGQDLNGAIDDWWFILLLRRPLWYRDASRDGTAHIEDYLTLHRDLLLGRESLSETQNRYLHEAERHFLDHEPPHNRFWHYGREWVRERMRAIENRRRIEADDFRHWGFKSPGAHVYLPELARAYPGLRYIHVTRSGLDMAFSTNQKQVLCWSWLVDMDVPVNSTPPPEVSLEYWLRANDRALRFCRTRLPDAHLVVQFESLCLRPREEVDRIARFLDVELDEETADGLSAIPRSPESIGRHREHDLSVFSSQQLEKLARLGYGDSSG
ncbi:MAG: sulfotransferase [Proteobacteria bacterium]|nr:MAG: sulfotransferase [Pseudomonadota bacterium]